MLGLQMAASRVVRPGFAPGILASGSTSQASVSPSLKWGPSPPLLDRGAARCPHNICFWGVPVPNIVWDSYTLGILELALLTENLRLIKPQNPRLLVSGILRALVSE